MSDKSSKPVINLEESIARPLCYVPVLGVIVAGVFLALDKRPKVRWDALQAALLWVAVVIMGWMLDVTIVGRGLIPLVNLVGMIVVPLVLAIKANKNEDTKIPILAEVADAVMARISGKVK